MARFQTVVTAVVANRTLVDGLEVRVQEPSVREAEETYLQATARESYEQMEHVRTREKKRLVMRCPPASPLFASWPWPRHNSMLVRSY
jgi:hypothetical protein